MKKRTPLSAAELHGLLERELQRRRARECETCYLHLPYRVDRASADAPNWEVVLPPACPLACRDEIEHLVSELADRYELGAA